MLEVDLDAVGGGAELLFVLLFDVEGVDDFCLFEAPEAGAEVVLVLLLVVEGHFVLVDQGAGQLVFVGFEHAIFGMFRGIVLELFPLLLMEDWE